MWELLKDVLWLVVLCIVGIAACGTYIVCLLAWKKNEIFDKPKRQKNQPLEPDEEVFTIHIEN